MSNTIKRKVELYRVEILNKYNEPYTDYTILQDFFEDFFTDYSINTMKTGYIVNSNKKCWVALANKNSIGDYDTLEVKLTYSKFNKKLKVIKVKDRTVIGGKSLDEGDEEKQHFIVKFFPKSNYALIVFEKILDSVSISFIKKTLNNYLKDIFIKSEKYNNKIKNRDLRFNIDPIISSDFIECISNLNGIKLLKTTVTKESVDDDLRFSGKCSRDEVDLTIKAENKLLMQKNQVITYCNKFINDGVIKDKRIIRIVIAGMNDNNNPVRLDTDGMKLSESINIDLDLNNTIDTNDIFNKFNSLLLSKEEELEKFFNVTLKEIALEQE
ncbi:hypothetical protein [Terrisporobacter hibernicus]|uniref:Uncharacterized protein n=1 Tax=Terrisporobacter hibernicus TaxID=2813371 RepID=A0AAX2ZKC4_9FIRM|nr:hypothetical protein [Terrisporobacter hibernicus]UEL48112.1 hypothetical protein JW646_01290 [Terrisporobacter hibernicus]